MKTIEQRIDVVVGFLADFDENPYNSVPPFTWDEFWRNCSVFIPEFSSGKHFNFENQCDVETIPYWDDDAETWSEYAYGFDLLRDEDGLAIIVHKFDGDCSWDEVDRLTEDERDNFCDAFSEYFDANHYFRGWAGYHIWCAQNGGVDPLKTLYDATSGSTIEKHLRAAEDNIKYLKQK